MSKAGLTAKILVNGRMRSCGSSAERTTCLSPGGENIHCEEIESALCQHAEIAAAIAVPIADAEFGHRPVAVLQTTALFAKPTYDAHLMGKLENSSGQSLIIYGPSHYKVARLNQRAMRSNSGWSKDSQRVVWRISQFRNDLVAKGISLSYNCES